MLLRGAADLVGRQKEFGHLSIGEIGCAAVMALAVVLKAEGNVLPAVCQSSAFSHGRPPLPRSRRQVSTAERREVRCDQRDRLFDAMLCRHGGFGWEIDS